MHGLIRSLKISGNELTNKAVDAILDSCPHLESLDLHSCFNIVLDDTIRAKYAGVKISVSPNDGRLLTDSLSIADGYEEYWDDVIDREYDGACYPSEFEQDNFDPYRAEFCD